MLITNNTASPIVLAGLTLEVGANTLEYELYVADEDRRAKINELNFDGELTVAFDDDDPDGATFPNLTAGEIEDELYGEEEFALKIGVAGVLTAAAGAEHIALPFPAKLVRVSAGLGTYVAGAALLLDVNKNGTTVFTTQGDRVTIADGAAEVVAKGPWTTADLAAKLFAKGDLVSVDVDQIGTTSGHHGSDLAVVLVFEKQAAVVTN